MNIYDRAGWPSPERNPLVQLLLRPEPWMSNGELATALGLVNTTRSKSVTGHWKSVTEELGKEETMFRVGDGVAASRQRVRCFSKKALVLTAMRARTINAAAFRDWLASRTAGEMANVRSEA